MKSRNKEPKITMIDREQEDKEMSWSERCSYKLDMVLSQLDRIVSMLFHTKAVLTTEEAAMYLGLTTGHLYRMVRKFNIPHTRPTNGKIYFRKDELDSWIATRTETTEKFELTETVCSADNNDTEPPMTDMYINWNIGYGDIVWGTESLNTSKNLTIINDYYPGMANDIDTSLTITTI